mmetsp:Transcript_45427/g.86867  ORF Transcript_45427/g.86867 Transcript_45427/m.86867 type:complete len:105 (+) Transcript_45427:442-756(+)
MLEQVLCPVMSCFSSRASRWDRVLNDQARLLASRSYRPGGIFGNVDHMCSRPYRPFKEFNQHNKESTPSLDMCILGLQWLTEEEFIERQRAAKLNAAIFGRSTG